MSTVTDKPSAEDVVVLSLCGDVMTGRGIDQILPHPCDPALYEPYVKDARDYCRLAERAHGAVLRPVDESYIWGDALEAWDGLQPDLRIVNLETAVTTSDAAWPEKGIHYRMSPANIGCLAAARIDCCALANNHVLDWGYAGLAETLSALRSVGIAASGAGENQSDAETAAAFDMGRQGRVLVFSFGMATSGIPPAWAAGDERAGVNWLLDASAAAAKRVAEVVARHRRPGDIVVASLHWGGNWGYSVTLGERRFAQRLIDEAGVDLVHGHSSHHPKGIEVYRDRLILYGCGDFLTDYEGISGYESFRGDLGALYFASLDPSSGHLVRLQMAPFQMHRLRLRSAGRDDVLWVCDVLNREGATFGTHVRLLPDETLALEWMAHGLQSKSE